MLLILERTYTHDEIADEPDGMHRDIWMKSADSSFAFAPMIGLVVACVIHRRSTSGIERIGSFMAMRQKCASKTTRTEAMEDALVRRRFDPTDFHAVVVQVQGQCICSRFLKKAITKWIAFVGRRHNVVSNHAAPDNNKENSVVQARGIRVKPWPELVQLVSLLEQQCLELI